MEKLEKLENMPTHETSATLTPVEPSAEHREAGIKAVAELATMLVTTALGLWVTTESLHLGLHNALGIGPGMFPMVSGVALSVLGAIGSIVALAALRRHRHSSVTSGPGLLHNAAPAIGEGHDVDAVVSGAQEALAVAVDQEAETFTGVLWVRLALAIVLLVGFVTFMSYLGFVVGLSVLMLLMMLLVAKRGLVFSIILTIATAITIYYGFGVFLDVVLPGPTAPFLSWLNP
jgi:hypothetical protein